MAKTKTVLSRVGLGLMILGTATFGSGVLAPPADAKSRSKQPAKAAPVVVSPALTNLPPPDPFPADTTPKPDLAIGSLHAAVSASDSGVVLAVGSSGFVTVSVTDSGGNKSVTLLAESEAGDIRAISGRGVRTSKVRGGLAADVPLLVDFFLKNLSEIYNRPLSINADARRFLQSLPLVGNIRQLKNLVERTVLVSPHDTLQLIDFQQHNAPPTAALPSKTLPEVGTMTLEEMEIQMIRRAMDFHKGKISRVARSLGLTRSALYRRLEKFGMPFSEDD